MAEQREPDGGWTLEALARYFSEATDRLRDDIDRHDKFNRERFQAAEKAVTSALSAADKALQKAEMASEKRFEGLNELRAMAADQTRMYMPRAEFDARHEVLTNKVEDTALRMTTLETANLTKRETATTSVGMIVAFVSVVYGIAATIGIILTLALRHG